MITPALGLDLDSRATARAPGHPTPALDAYGGAILGPVARRFGDRRPHLVVEPGRGVVGDAGTPVVYRLRTDHDDEPTGPAVLAGPTCDSVDVLHEEVPVHLPLTLAEGDEVRFASAGAYTTSYSTVGLNGFAPLPTVLG